MREENAFMPVHSIEEFSDAKRDPKTVSIKNIHGKRVVVYHYVPFMVGAPDRSTRPDISCEIKPGELVRVEYNGRFSDPCHNWSYCRQIFNIIYTDKLGGDSFLVKPDHHIKDLADLL